MITKVVISRGEFLELMIPFIEKKYGVKRENIDSISHMDADMNQEYFDLYHKKVNKYKVVALCDGQQENREIEAPDINSAIEQVTFSLDFNYQDIEIKSVVLIS